MNHRNNALSTKTIIAANDEENYKLTWGAPQCLSIVVRTGEVLLDGDKLSLLLTIELPVPKSLNNDCFIDRVISSAGYGPVFERTISQSRKVSEAL